MGVIWQYTCRSCGYEAEVHEGAGFRIESELRHCRATNDLVGVIVSVHDLRDGEPPTDLPVGRCDGCGSDDVHEPARAGARGRPLCPRCGEETGRADVGRWD